MMFLVRQQPCATTIASLLVLLAAMVATVSHGFVVAPLAARPPYNPVGIAPSPELRLKTTLYREEEDNNNEGPSAAETAKEEEGQAEESSSAPEEEEQAEEEQAPPEDPEVTALKEEIAALEKSLKEKESKVEYLKNDVDQYSKGGYARKVAEMENMRRIRSSMASSNKETSIASILREFLPVMDQLDALKVKYQDDDYGQKYVALAGNMKSALSNMGVAEYAVAAGEPMERTRMVAVQEEYSTEQPKDKVLECLRAGLELKGNIVRLAEVKTSLGDEAAAKAAEEEAAAAAEGGDEAPEQPAE